MSLGQLQTTASTESFQDFFEVSDDTFVEYDQSLRCKAINRAGAALLELQVADVSSRTYQELIESGAVTLLLRPVLTQMVESVQRTLATAEKQVVVHEIPTTDGVKVYETIYTPISDASGIVDRVFSVGREIVSRQHLQPQVTCYAIASIETKRQEPESPQSILDALPQSIFWKDNNSVYLGCNRSWADTVGLDDPKDMVKQIMTCLGCQLR